MNLKEYNILVEEISNFIKPLNQILYQILILITLYLLFNNLKYYQTASYSQTTQQNILQNYKIHKSFIILFTVLSVCLDWFIWNNTTQTTLFISILTIYIYYNLKNLSIISTFINFTKELSNLSPITTDSSNNINEHQKQCIIPILPIPDIYTNYNDIPLPFDINSTETKEINEVYKIDKPYISITDTKYAEIILNDLYKTPQYKNIIHNTIDTTLNNNIHFEYNQNNEELLNSFTNPKKEFLDSSWLNNRTK